MLKTFGIYGEEQVLFPSRAEAGSEGQQEAVLNLAGCISDFRFQIRKIAAAGADKSQIFAACEELRNSQLLKLGVFLEDQSESVFVGEAH